MAALTRIALIGAFLPLSAAAAIIHYVQSASPGACADGEACTAIGIPVPLPQDSQSPVAGFRTYSALIAGLQDLVSQNGDVATFQSTGKTAAGRDIWSFSLGDPDALTADGLPEPAFLQSGGIHAREWIAPEVVAGLIERLLGNRSDHALYEYLLENVHTVAVPVLNVDGFVQTQRYPDRAQQTTCPEDAPDEPRDGRMRRKNMNADGVPVDEVLATLSDAMLGIDANRNNRPWWGGAAGSSGTPCSLLYRGVAAESEPEVQALQAAAALAPANRLRLYIDTHSYTRAYLAADTSNARRNALQQQLAQRMSAVAGGVYGYSSSPSGSGIGSTDEYFANTYQIPAYTLESEPQAPSGLADYGGINVPDSGFILPAGEVPRVRSTLVDATVLGIYRQAGPPSVAAVTLSNSGDNAAVFSGQWQASGSNARHFVVDTRQPLQTNASYELWIAFNKPMRARDGNQAVAQYPGQNVALAPTLTLEGVDAQGRSFTVPIATAAGAWLNSAGGAPASDLRYADDAYAVQFQIPASAPLAGAKRLALAVTAADFSGQPLDANPATAIDWRNGGWSGYESADCSEGDVGGTDRSVRLIDDGTSVCAPAAGGGGGGGGSLDVSVLLGLAAGALCRRRRIRT